jgi:hypothetical protein
VALEFAMPPPEREIAIVVRESGVDRHWAADLVALAGRLRALLGERFATFVENTGVQSPLLEEDGILYVTGNKQHSGGTDAAALVADLRRDAIWVWLLTGGESEACLDRDVEVELPADVRIVLENAEPAPAPPEDEEGLGEHEPDEEAAPPAEP